MLAGKGALKRIAGCQAATRANLRWRFTVLTVAATTLSLAAAGRVRAYNTMELDPEGFDPYRDTVGPGIYSGKVKRDEQGNVIIGRWVCTR